MTRLQKIQLEQSQERAKLGKLLDTKAEERSETFGADVETATARLKALEVTLQAALLAEPEDRETDETTTETTETTTETAEDRELRELRGRANVAKIIKGVLDGYADGPERELQAALKLPGNAIPLAMLVDEQRAAVALSGDEPAGARPVVPQVFPASIAAFAGVSIETVPTGQAVYPVITTGVTIHTPAGSAAAAETDAVIAVSTLTPKRLQGNIAVRREDLATYPGLDSGLRMNLSDAVEAKIDNVLMNRASDGLLKFGTDPTNPSAATTISQYLAAIYDGRRWSLRPERGGRAADSRRGNQWDLRQDGRARRLEHE